MHSDLVTNNSPRSIALFPGSFHPVTVAHLGIAQAALKWADNVWLVLPRSFPHKSYDSVTLQDRLDLINASLTDPRMAAMITEGGLFIEMVQECRRRFPNIEKIYVVCGRDAAERIVNWDYDGMDPIEEQLEQYELLVAARVGEFKPPTHLAHRIHPLIVERDFDEVSATSLREAIRRGESWEHLTPAIIRDRVRALYSPGGIDSRKALSR